MTNKHTKRINTDGAKERGFLTAAYRQFQSQFGLNALGGLILTNKEPDPDDIIHKIVYETEDREFKCYYTNSKQFVMLHKKRDLDENE